MKNLIVSPVVLILLVSSCAASKVCIPSDEETCRCECRDSKDPDCVSKCLLGKSLTRDKVRDIQVDYERNSHLYDKAWKKLMKSE